MRSRIARIAVVTMALIALNTSITFASTSQPANIWDFTFSGSSVNAQGQPSIGNLQMHGPLYVRGNFQLAGSIGYYDGPLYVKQEPSTSGIAGVGFFDLLSGDIDLQGSTQLGLFVTPVSVYAEGECPGCSSAPPCYCSATIGEPVPNIPLPELSSADMQVMYLSADLLYDPPAISSSDPRNAASMDGNQVVSIVHGETQSFDHTLTDRNGDGFPNGTGHFKWDLPTNTMSIDGTVFVDGDLEIEGSNDQTIKYQGTGTLYVNGDITLNNERFRASSVTDFPVTSDLGLVTPYAVNVIGNNCPACSGSDPAYQLAVFGGTSINVLKQTHLNGSLITGSLSFSQVPDLYSEPLLSANLPPNMPGAELSLDLKKPDTWINSACSGTISSRDATFTWGGSDDITASSELTFSYMLSSIDAGWSTYDSSRSKNYSSLPDGTYTFKVRSRDSFGNEDYTEAQTSFSVDAPTTARYENTSPEIVYSPSCWSNYSNGLLSGGSAKVSKNRSCSAALNYTGSKVEFISARANKLGRTRVYIDSVLQGTLDLYASATTTQISVYEYDHVVSGFHSIKVEVVGSKNIRSKGSWVPIDAFDITN